MSVRQPLFYLQLYHIVLGKREARQLYSKNSQQLSHGSLVVSLASLIQLVELIPNQAIVVKLRAADYKAI